MISIQVHEEFCRELAKLLNKHSVDAQCEIPDFILAAFLTGIIENLRLTVKGTAHWKAGTPMEWE